MTTTFDSKSLNQIKKIEYLDLINNLSYNYLLGSEWYIGREYTREYYFNSLDESIKYKLIFLIHFLSSIYKK